MRTGFLLTPLREGRPITSASWSGRKLFLLTPLREGRRAAADAAVLPAAISTHAPAGGATKLPAAGSTSALNFYSRPCGRGDGAPLQASRPAGQFLLTPLREGRPDAALQTDREDWISTHAPAGGATDGKFHIPLTPQEFLLTPLREGRPRAGGRNDGNEDHFYSRPCGRGDFVGLQLVNVDHFISTHAPAGGATFAFSEEWDGLTKFLLTPLREGRQKIKAGQHVSNLFLLTPLREGRLVFRDRADGHTGQFLLTPLREGRPYPCKRAVCRQVHFYSRPCGRGDLTKKIFFDAAGFLLTPLREGRLERLRRRCGSGRISTHAPAGGATQPHIYTVW